VFYADSRCNRLMRKKHIFQAAAALASLLAQLLQVPCAISRPPAMTRIRSAIRSATSRMCVVMITTGKWMFAARVVPRHVIFSYTAAGQPWADMESSRRSSCFGSTIQRSLKKCLQLSARLQARRHRLRCPLGSSILRFAPALFAGKIELQTHSNRSNVIP
jgi:hypothetical protein